MDRRAMAVRRSITTEISEDLLDGAVRRSITTEISDDLLDIVGSEPPSPATPSLRSSLANIFSMQAGSEPHSPRSPATPNASRRSSWASQPFSNRPTVEMAEGGPWATDPKKATPRGSLRKQLATAVSFVTAK